ncbi:hypothetical protein ILYODFUR_028264 [Ilyodon furcidens]|uniref:Uncharacterized protein n=1 Tax=Ilyodon furcidens TaxID=33524 RepID=A0ABV0TMD2_9TELE
MQMSTSQTGHKLAVVTPLRFQLPPHPLYAPSNPPPPPLLLLPGPFPHFVRTCLIPRIQVSSYFLCIKFKLAASWLFDHPDQIISEPCPPSNQLSRKYLQPVHHTINPLSSHSPGSELLRIYLHRTAPALCSQTPHLSSLWWSIFLPPLEIYQSRISNPFHS